MLKTFKLHNKWSAKGILLHHFVRNLQPLQSERLLHQTIPNSCSDDSNENNNDKNKIFDKEPRNPSKNYKHLRHISSGKNTSEKGEKHKSSLEELLTGLKVDTKVYNKFNKQRLITRSGEAAPTGRELYINEAYDQSRNNRKIMPKEDKLHLEPLREHRKAKRKRDFIKGVPHYMYFQVVGNGALGGGKSLFLYTDATKYLFNCGEGSQRACLEYGGHRTLSNMTDIFVTKNSWKNLGGLPGMLLSVRSTGAPDITIHGPPVLMNYMRQPKPLLFYTILTCFFKPIMNQYLKIKL